MAIPLFCSKCGDVIGIEDVGASLGRLHSGDFDSHVHVSCPGTGKHTEPERSEEKQLFGLLQEITMVYPETHTQSVYHEYIGPPSLFMLWFAIMFGTSAYGNGDHDGVLVNHKWVWWSASNGFYGDGYEELQKQKRAQKARV